MARPRTKQATPTIVGINVHRLRGERGLTQKALADAAGVSLATITAVELGRYRSTGSQTIVSLARALDTEPAALFVSLQESSSDQKRVAVAQPAAEESPAALGDFHRSRWSEAVRPTRGELSWLSLLPASVWRGMAVDHQAIAELIAWRRRNQ